MGKLQRRFGKDSEAKAVRLVETRGRTQREIAEDLGIGLSTLRRCAGTPKPPDADRAGDASFDSGLFTGQPAATPRQNRYRFSRYHTGGRPGEDNLRRVERSDFCLPGGLAVQDA